jgi:hypothetical protein
MSVGELGRRFVKRIQVERKNKVSPANITKEHLRDVGRPVIITDATENWLARSKWTFEFFRTRYGSDIATAWLDGVRRGGGIAGKLTSLSTYIDFLDDPWELPGLWIGNDGRPLQAAPGHRTSPPYLVGWYAFRQHPELYDDIAPAPYFAPDLVSVLSPTLREIFQWTCEREYSAIYIGPKDSLSSLHRDFWNTHGYLAQIRGRKRVILFSPEDSDFLYGGRVDPEHPDFEQFPLFARATAYECVIEPGDTLLTPANWWHHVRSLEKSITMSHNFFNDSNFTEHMIHLIQNLPRLVQAMEKSPDCREKLSIKWCSRDLASNDVPTTVWTWNGFQKPT